MVLGDCSMGTSSEPEDLSFSTDDEGAEEVEAPKASLYITVDGANRLRAELKHLASVERPKVTNEVSVAAAMGDRSENAEYIYGKKRLREIDRRMHFLQKRLDKLTVVDPHLQKDESKVYFGATVTLENDDDGGEVTYQLVGPDETDLKTSRISVDSPVGKAMMGKRAGDLVTVRRPKGEVDFTIISIRYV